MKKRNKNVTIVKTAIIAGTLAVTTPQAAFAETSANTTTVVLHQMVLCIGAR